MINRGEILIVDNDIAILHSWSGLLRQKAYAVYVAQTTPEAFHLLAQKEIDLAIIDVRLVDDQNAQDRSGIELVEKMPPEIVKLLVNASDSFEYSIWSPRNVWHFAKKLAAEDLPQVVEQIFRERVRLNQHLAIEFADGLSLMRLVQTMKVYRKATPTQLLQAVYELDKLLRRLFLRETRLEVSHLLSGMGGAGVFLAQPYYPSKGAYVVVKFDDRDKLASEVKNYKEYVEPYIQIHSTDIVGDIAQTKHLTGARFRFVGAYRGGKTTDLATVYADLTLTDEVIEEIIDDLFAESCRLWYDAKRPFSPALGDDSTAVSYQKSLHLAQPAGWQELWQELKGVCALANDDVAMRPILRQQLRITTPHGETILPNPVAFIETWGHLFPPPTFCCITHGDLNGRNIFVDDDSHTWLIDFTRTGWGPALRDVAELESVFKFDLQPETNLMALLAFEDQLLLPNTFSQSAAFKTHNPHLRRAASAIAKVRRIAWQIAEQDDLHEYYVALLFYALKNMTLETVSRSSPDKRPSRQRHALYSAAKICQKLQPWLETTGR